MKVISLNIWAGREFDPLMEFISVHSKNTDIFCFQEVFSTTTKRKRIGGFYRANVFEEMQKILPEHKGYFAPIQEKFGYKSSANFDVTWGIAMFIRKSVKVKKIGDFFIFGKRNGAKKDPTTLPRNLQYTRIFHNGKDYTIGHFHGLFNGNDKLDHPSRIEQSRKAKKFLKKERDKIILMGDFNLWPETKSIKILEKGMINLIKMNKIKTTRNALYKYHKIDKFADYTIVSKNVKVKSFKVPMLKISDHLPMILEFE